MPSYFTIIKKTLSLYGTLEEKNLTLQYSQNQMEEATKATAAFKRMRLYFVSMVGEGVAWCCIVLHSIPVKSLICGKGFLYFGPVNQF